jgi:hypothetical protein
MLTVGLLDNIHNLIYPVIAAFEVNVSLIVMEKKRFIHMTKERDPIVYARA